MTDFSEGEDEVFSGNVDSKNTSDEDELDVAAGRRWDPLGEEKETGDPVGDESSCHDGWVTKFAAILQL